MVIFLTLLYFYSRGFIPHDEGWIISPAERIIQGEIPYRDFHYLYLPGVAYVVAMGFKLFGVSIFVSRMVSFFFTLIAIYALILISKIVNKNSYSYLIPVLIFIAWGPSHLNFAHPTIFAVFGGIIACLFLYLGREKPFLLFLAGVTTGLTILFKQNFGVALLINNIIFFIFENNFRNKKIILYHFLGLILFPILLLIYFALNNAFIPFFQDMYFFMIREMIEKGHQATLFIYPDIWYKEIAKTLFYLSPLLISLPAIYFAFKKNRKILFFATFAALYYVIGIRPTTDYVHLVGLLSLIGVPLLMLITFVKNQYMKLGFYGIFILFFLLGMYTAIFSSYYKWNPPLIQQNIYTSSPKLGVYTDLNTHIVISDLNEYFKKHPTKNDYIFIDSFAPSFYVVTDKKNPTKYIFFTWETLTLHDEKIMINEIKEKNTPFILTENGIEKDNTLLAQFIKSTYRFDYNADGYFIFKKK
ncbi:MAG TPA: glycosyltransferase family 39 protein [Verrucomicrobiae bacterium]|nr:glycosyltransferase family 39 protein [Verrucomicrobiae bacterium]